MHRRIVMPLIALMLLLPADAFARAGGGSRSFSRSPGYGSGGRRRGGGGFFFFGGGGGGGGGILLLIIIAVVAFLIFRSVRGRRTR